MLIGDTAVECLKTKAIIENKKQGHVDNNTSFMFFSGVNTAKGGKNDELLTTMVCCSALGIFSPIHKIMQLHVSCLFVFVF